VRARRVHGVHLLEDDEQVVLPVGRDAVDQHRDDRLTLGLAPGSEPQRDRGEVVEHPRGPVGQRRAGERLNERAKVVQIVARARIHPPLHRVGGERQDNGVDGPLSFVWLDVFHRRASHR
jgi:hypothetical protein